ncbi:MAG: hypothetical protein V9E88_10735 [Ferruginibacter sp.]
MKVFLLILLMMPLGLLAQPAPNAAEDITGTWTGYVSTDQKKLHYEVVLSDSSGILTGFSKIIFNVKGEQYSAVKSLIVKREKNKYILEEDKLLYDNLQDDGPKKIRQINTVWLEVTDKAIAAHGLLQNHNRKGYAQSKRGDQSAQRHHTRLIRITGRTGSNETGQRSFLP